MFVTKFVIKLPGIRYSLYHSSGSGFWVKLFKAEISKMRNETKRKGNKAGEIQNGF